MINLFENYNQETQELHQSLKRAGYNHFTIVINDDGFLPDDVTSPYRFFTAYQIYEDDTPAFFNDIDTPPFWEIKGDATMATITDMGELRGKIFYKEHYKTRVVSHVEWLDSKQRLRSVDYYTKEGFKFAETVYDLLGNAILKKYMTREGKEVIYENYVTNDVVVEYEGKSYFFESYTEWIKFYLSEMGVEIKEVIFNTLSTPFLAIYHLPTLKKGILFWQEQSQGYVPGNMKVMLSPNLQSRFAVIVPNQNEYKLIKEQLSREEQQAVYASGYLYDTYKRNHYSKNVLTLTNSDQIPHVETLVRLHKDYQFHIGAKTEMSSKLLSLSQYENVKLYPIIKEQTVQTLYQQCDIYLDINEGNEIGNAVRSAYNHQLLIMGYKEVVHNRDFVAIENQFLVNDISQLSNALKEIGNHRGQFETRLALQQRHANAVPVSTFKYALVQALSG